MNRGWLAVSCVIAALAAPAMAAEPIPPTALEPGDYLLRDYAQSLQQSRSPLAAHDVGDRPQVISVRRVDNDLLLDAKYNWHEGCRALTAHVGGSGPATVEDGDCAKRADFQVQDSRHLTFRGQAYDLVGNAKNYIVGITVGGTYEDRNHRRYVFGSDGQASFPGTKFPVEICLDQAVPPCSDYDRLDDQKNQMGFLFRRSGDTLLLFRAPTKPEDPADYGHPVLELHRVGDAQP